MCGTGATLPVAIFVKSFSSCAEPGSSYMLLNIVRAISISLHLSSSMSFVTGFFLVDSDKPASARGSFVSMSIFADFHLRLHTDVFAENDSYSAVSCASTVAMPWL